MRDASAHAEGDVLRVSTFVTLAAVDPETRVDVARLRHGATVTYVRAVDDGIIVRDRKGRALLVPSIAVG